jgi:hypothetical protein
MNEEPNKPNEQTEATEQTDAEDKPLLPGGPTSEEISQYFIDLEARQQIEGRNAARFAEAWDRCRRR